MLNLQRIIISKVEMLGHATLLHYLSNKGDPI